MVRYNLLGIRMVGGRKIQKNTTEEKEKTQKEQG